MCQIHFNIGKKVEVNPFENVKYVKVAEGACSNQVQSMNRFLHKKANSVETRKIGDIFYILFNVELLDFTTLLKWLAPYRGIFWYNNHNIHFSIEDDVMNIW